MSVKVAVVTGSNKGIGFAIVRGLCKRFDGKVYLTARDVDRGKKAVAELEKEGLKPNFHQLDITDPKSVETLRDYIKEKYGGLDVLVNNAAIIFLNDTTEPPSVQAEQTLFVNYFSLLSTCNILFPILRDGARVVNVTSSLGHSCRVPSETLRNEFRDPSLTVERLSELMQQFIDDVKQGTHAERWGDTSYVHYAISKVGASALTRIQQKMLNDRNIKVNSVHPGYVDTDLNGHTGHLSIDEGASAPLFLALDAPDDVRGQFLWHDSKIIDWTTNECELY